MTDASGSYRFVTVKPGAYPWRNHHNAWRPAHIHFSVLGRSFTQRLVTQMYFPGDPSSPTTPSTTPSPTRRPANAWSPASTSPPPSPNGPWPTASTWSSGAAPPPHPTPTTTRDGPAASLPTPSQTVGPFFAVGLLWPDGPYVVPDGTPGGSGSRAGCWTRPATRSPTPWPRPGRPAPTAGSPSPATGSGGSGGARRRRGPVLRGDGQAGTGAASRRRAAAPCRPGDLRQGLLRQVVTRVYFADEPAANAADPVLAALAAPARATLLADPVAGGYTSTSTSRGSMPPPSSPSEGSLFAGVFAHGRVAAEVDDRALLQAMLDTEAALARASARPGWSRSRPPRRSPPCRADRSTRPSWGAVGGRRQPGGAAGRPARRPAPARGRRPRP